MTAEALKTISNPMTTSTSVAPKSHLSTPTRFAIRLLCALPFGESTAGEDQVLEDLPALFIVLELIEAGAGRREQNDLARLRGVGGFGHRYVESAGVDDGRGALDVRDDFFGGGTNGVDGLYALLYERTHEAVVGVLVLAAKDEVNARGEGRDGLHGGVDVRGLRVVIVVDSVDGSDELKAVLDGAEGLDSAPDGLGSNLGEAGGA